MTDNEIKANYLEVYTDISRLKEDFKNVQKPINDVVGKFFGTSPVNTTLAGINEFTNKHTHSVDAVNAFFGVPTRPIIMDLIKIIETITRQETLGSIMNKFLSRESASETSLKGPTLTEIKRAIDEQKFTHEYTDKFFQGSRPQDITTTFSYIDRYIKDQDQLGIRSLLVPFFFNRDGRIIKTDEIKANYLDIYRDISNLKEKVKIPHPYPKNIVYTVESGTMDWIKDTNTTLFISITARGTKWFSGIYRLTLISKHQFNIIIDGKTYPDNTATFIFNGNAQLFNLVAVNSSVARSKITWCLEFIDEADIPTEF